jgi:hypothetical protein
MARSRDYSGDRSRSQTRSYTRSPSRSRSRPRPRSIFGFPDPRPGKSDPEQRQLRKQQEQEANFNWKPLIIVGLIGTTLWKGFNKSLDKCEKRHEEEEREEEERRRRRRDRSYGSSSRGRDRSYDGRGRKEYDERRGDPRRRSEGWRYAEGGYDRDPRERSRPLRRIEGPPREREYGERYQQYPDARYEREMEFERPRGRVYRERMRRRDSSW